MPHLDLVADLLDRVRRRAKIAPELLRDVEREARKEWGGSRHYVLKGSGDNRLELMARDECIRADHARLVAGGMPAAESRQYLARRFALSLRRIEQIIAN